MKRGTTDIIDPKRGETDINAIYRGETLIWERGGAGFIMPNWRSESWTYDQRDSVNSIPNGGFINPLHYLQNVIVDNSSQSWNNGLTASDFVSIQNYWRISNSSERYLNRAFIGNFEQSPRVTDPAVAAAQYPGLWLEASEDYSTNNYKINSILIKLYNDSNFKSGFVTNSTTSESITFDSPFDDTNYSVIVSYYRKLPNLRPAMSGWYLNNKTTSGFDYYKGGMTTIDTGYSAILNPGYIAVKHCDNDIIKAGSSSGNVVTVNFENSFSDTNYEVFIMRTQTITLSDSNIVYQLTKSTTGFSINSSAVFDVDFDWVAVKTNYTNYENNLII